MTDKQLDSFEQTIDFFIKTILSKKAMAVVALDVRDLTSVADAFIICSGRSNRQVAALAEFIKKDLKNQGKKALSIEGRKDGHWVLMDYGDVIIHIFYEPLRSFYDLEGLWADARRIQITDQDEPEGKNPDMEVFIE
ncbi:MAG: ribosome silencing factor [Deltaproteobacteria bacterium]|nr:ribosome silencing factor [Deltaproteobacteria bacterium]